MLRVAVAVTFTGRSPAAVEASEKSVVLSVRFELLRTPPMDQPFTLNVVVPGRFVAASELSVTVTGNPGPVEFGEAAHETPAGSPVQPITTCSPDTPPIVIARFVLPPTGKETDAGVALTL